MELRHYASIFWRWLWLIVLVTILAAGASYLVSRSMPKVYAASTTLLVNEAQTSSTDAYSSILTSQQLAMTYSELIRKRPVLQSAIAALNLVITPEQLGKQLSVQVVRNTTLLVLTAQSEDAHQAADIANAVAQAFIDQNRRMQLGQAAVSRDSLEQQLQALENDIRTTSTQLDQLRSGPSNSASETATQAEIARLQSTLSQDQIAYSQLLKADQDMQLAESKAYSSVSVAEPAVAPVNPISPKTAVNVLLAALFGLMLAGGIAVLIEYLDDTVKTRNDVVKALGVPVLGQVVRMRGREMQKGVVPVIIDPWSTVAEAFRALRTNLQFCLMDRPIRAILVTSSSPQEGKTTTVVNLAMVMAQSGQSVIVVDADLRRPSLHEHFGMENDRGVTNALLEPCAPREVLRPAPGAENLMVLTSGPLPPNPSELLGSTRMAALVESLKGMADIVLLDSPPALAVTDPSVLARLVDGIVVIVDSSRTRLPALAQTRETLDRAAGPSKLLGAVLNKLGPKARGYYYQYYRRSRDVEEDRKNGHQKIEPAVIKGAGAGQRTD